MQALRSALVFGFVVMAVGGIGGPVAAIGDTRGNESRDSDTPVEQLQECTPIGRVDHARHMKLEPRRLTVVLDAVASIRLGHAQNIVLLVPDGHRLANGLLAPLTC